METLCQLQYKSMQIFLKKGFKMMEQQVLNDVQLMEINNYPSAPKLFNSLRHLGYDHMDCIKDIIDNSIDAKAKNINTSIKWDSKHKR